MEIREAEPLQQLHRTFVRFRGRRLSYFSGCDYFRLASHPRVLAALKRAADQHGLNVAASRVTTGNHRLYQELEAKLARFFQAPAALLVPTGYVSNLAVAESMAGHYSHALIDARSHPSLQTAAQMLSCPVLEFAHRDIHALERCLHRCGPGAKPILLTDGMFARDGSVAPLQDYLRVLPADGLILVDDAHGAGVLGTHGRGTPEHWGVEQRRIVQTVTLSKAFGVYGGAVLSSLKLRRTILQRSHMFVGGTPFPLPLAAAAMESLALLRNSRGAFRQRLIQNTAFVRNHLHGLGMELPDNPGPIVALVPRSPRQAAQITHALLGAGILPPFVKYPGAPQDGYFRFVISSEHTLRQLQNLVAALRKAALGQSTLGPDPRLRKAAPRCSSIIS